MKPGVWVLGVLLVAIVGGGVYFTTRSTEGDAVMGEKGEVMVKEDITEKDAAMNKDSTMMEDTAMMEKQGTYETYSPEKLALAKDGKVALFFHATWCPICRAIDSEVNAGAVIPDGIHILKVDYDTATALKQKYGVTVQHTFVQVDASGAAIQKFNDASTLAAAVMKLK